MIYDANRFMLAALLSELGCAVTDFGIRADREAALADTLVTASAGHDLIVTSGGVSTGEEDHVKPAIERLGGLHFWRLAIKPGRISLYPATQGPSEKAMQWQVQMPGFQVPQSDIDGA